MIVDIVKINPEMDRNFRYIFLFFYINSFFVVFRSIFFDNKSNQWFNLIIKFVTIQVFTKDSYLRLE